MIDNNNEHNFFFYANLIFSVSEFTLITFSVPNNNVYKIYIQFTKSCYFYFFSK